MKLVDILASELQAWPVEHGVEFVTQGNTGHVYGWRGEQPVCIHGEWFWSDDGSHEDFTPWRPGNLAMSEDRKEAIVTREQWEAAVEALKIDDEPSQSIDWGKAPEDATHFSPAYEGYIDLWAKTDGNRWMYRSMDASKWHYGPPPEQDEYYVERPLRAVESMALHHQEVGRITRVWNGEGLPPVGLQVENKMHGPVMVLAHGIFRGGDVVICQGDDTIITCTPDTLLPIRTAEQIAADERLHQVRNALSAIHAGQLFPNDFVRGNIVAATVEAMIDAGYRKQGDQ